MPSSTTLYVNLHIFVDTVRLSFNNFERALLPMTLIVATLVKLSIFANLMGYKGYLVLICIPYILVGQASFCKFIGLLFIVGFLKDL